MNLQDLNPASVPNLAGRVLTVLGPVEPSALGQTLMHEHLLVDLRRPEGAKRPDEDAPEAAEPLTLANLARTRNGGTNADNDVIDDIGLMLREVARFRDAGGGTIVDVTGPQMGRDPQGLAEISRRSGLHIVMGGGTYTTDFHPDDFGVVSDDELAWRIVRDITVGPDATGVRTGIIGEIGAEGAPLSDAEWRGVRAAARASRITGAPISFHVGGQGEEKLRVIDTCLAEGVAPTSVVIGHAGVLVGDRRLAERVLATGVTIEFDFLASPGSPWGHLFLGSDRGVADGAAQLIADGYGSQIVLGHDICQKIQLASYGGAGYDYISRHFLPALRERGVTDEQVRALMVDNAARALMFVAPATVD